MKVIAPTEETEALSADQLALTPKTSPKDPFRVFFSHPFGFLSLWIIIGTVLRFTHLDAKPLWTDEFSTLVFSLGNSFQSIPLDQTIFLSTLLEPLQYHSARTFGDVIDHLLTQSNHPPLFFLLTHGWIQMWQQDGTQVSVWVARSLSAILGVAAIPAIYRFGSWVFQSRLAGHFAAAMMAVSPYSIYLAQEARHYTLAILCVMASLACWSVAVRHLYQRTPFSRRIVVLWILMNGLGIATHYFFALTLMAQGIVLGVIIFRDREKDLRKMWAYFNRLIAVSVGTLVSGLIWVPVFMSNGYGSELTEWIKDQDLTWSRLISPVFQALAGWITMISLLPVESSSLPIIIGSVVVMVVFFIGFLPWLFLSLKILGGWGTRSVYFNHLWRGKAQALVVRAILGFILSSITIFLGFTYLLGIDLTRGARYNFVYFPAVILGLGVALSIIWQLPIIQRLPFLLYRFTGQKVVILVLLMGLGSGITVISNLGYQKYYRPDLLVNLIRETSSVPVLIATSHQTHVQTGELMSIAWQWQQITPLNPESDALEFPTQVDDQSPIKFLLLHQKSPDQNQSLSDLKKAINQSENYVDLWLVNFENSENLILDNCQRDLRKWPGIDGYNYQVFHCQNS